MINYISLFIISTLFYSLGMAQPVTEKLCNSAEFDQEIRSWIDFSVPIISASSLASNDEKVILLDARELNEYKISHIPGAKYIGYNNFKKKNLEGIDKEAKIVVYCSIGYRSEKIGEKLQSLGYKQVFNLYGSIFEWANQGHPLIDEDGNPTKKLHTFNRKWSKWVDETKVEKQW